MTPSEPPFDPQSLNAALSTLVELLQATTALASSLSTLAFLLKCLLVILLILAGFFTLWLLKRWLWPFVKSAAGFAKSAGTALKSPAKGIFSKIKRKLE